MILEKYSNIVSGRQKPRFVVSREKLEKLVKDIKSQKAWIKENNNDHELEPLQTAGLCFSGSLMNCEYFEDSDKLNEKHWTEKQTAKWMDERAREKKGVVLQPGNIKKNLIHIIKALLLMKRSAPIVWKSDGYYPESVANLLKDIADVYIIDFKYFSDECSSFLGKVEDYVENVKRNILIAEKHGDLIIDHRILPSHIECDSKQMLEWIKNTLKKFNLRMSAEYKPIIGTVQEISRRVTISEYNDVMKYAKRIGLDM